METISSPFSTEGKTRPTFDASSGHRMMWYNQSPVLVLRKYTCPRSGSSITTSLIRWSKVRPYCIADRAAIGKYLAFIM